MQEIIIGIQLKNVLDKVQGLDILLCRSKTSPATEWLNDNLNCRHFADCNSCKVSLTGAACLHISGQWWTWTHSVVSSPVAGHGPGPHPATRRESRRSPGTGLPATWPASRSRELEEHKYVDVCKNSGENHLKHSERRTKISYLQLICLMYTIFDTSVWCLNVKVTV